MTMKTTKTKTMIPDYIALARKAQSSLDKRVKAFIPTHKIKSGTTPVCIYTKGHTFPMFNDTMFIDAKGQLYNYKLKNAVAIV